MLTWNTMTDQYLQWYRTMTGLYLDLMRSSSNFMQQCALPELTWCQFREGYDHYVDEMWRRYRLPSLKEVTRLHESLDRIQAQLDSMHECDLAEDVASALQTTKGLATVEDLKSIRKALSQIEKQIAAMPQTGSIEKSMNQVAAKSYDIAKELTQLKKSLAQLGSEVSALTKARQSVSEQTSE